MRRAAFLLFVLTACTLPSSRDSRDDNVVGTARHAFTSADAVLVDFDFDAKLVAPTNDPIEVRHLLETQLMYLVGQLNGARSVGRHDRLELSITSTHSFANASYEIEYHAKLPVAWGAGGAPPPLYTVTLPLRVGEADRADFATKYAATCADPEGGVVGADRMFLFFRPRRQGCTLTTADVVSPTATVRMSTENTTGKYPDYHRVWADDTLHVVAVFGRELYDDANNNAPDDGGVGAYDSFVERATQYLRSLQPDDAQRAVTSSHREAHLTATLPLGKHHQQRKAPVRIDIEAILIGPSVADDAATFDAWYDARTPDADIIVYSGHAGLGENVRTLANKGTFRSTQYVISVLNGCDTFAYLDRTLADRRFVLNPDDPSGTKYMDVVSNVLGGYFHTGDETSLHLVRALVSALDETPKTYPQIFEDIDATQVMVVSGEEDNEFVPEMLKASSAAPAPRQATPGVDDGARSVPNHQQQDRAQDFSLYGGSMCSAASHTAKTASPMALSVVMAALASFAVRLRRRTLGARR